MWTNRGPISGVIGDFLRALRGDRGQHGATDGPRNGGEAFTRRDGKGHRMKGIRHSEYGPPEVVTFVDVDLPAFGGGADRPAGVA